MSQGMVWSAVAFASCIAGILMFNKLVRFKMQVRSAWADIDAQLKKRHDLVPNLVEVVKGYADYERSTLEKVTAARSAAMRPGRPVERAEAEKALGSSLQGMFVLAESYPSLKASENYLALQNQLREVEDDIEHARRYYNAVVRDFNTVRESFPSNIVAGLFRFPAAELFTLENEKDERSVPAVQL